jgi:hypothetical protein
MSIAVALACTLIAADPSAVLPWEIERYIHASDAIHRIHTGVFSARPRISLDGKWITWVRTTEDIHNAEIMIMRSDGEGARKINAPYGWKMDPVIVGGDYDDGYASKHPRFLLVHLDPRGKKKGVYAYDLDGRGAWRMWREGSWSELAIDSNARFLALVRAELGEPGPAHYQKRPQDELWVQPIREGRPEGAPYRVANNIGDLIRDPTFGPEAHKIYFTVFKDKDDGTGPMLYEVDNQAGAEAIDQMPGAVDPAAAWFGSMPKAGTGDIIVFSRLLRQPSMPMPTPTRDLYRRNLTTNVTDVIVRCEEPVYCSQPFFHPLARVLFFTVQIGSERGGLLATNY